MARRPLTLNKRENKTTVYRLLTPGYFFYGNHRHHRRRTRRLLALLLRLEASAADGSQAGGRGRSASGARRGRCRVVVVLAARTRGGTEQERPGALDASGALGGLGICRRARPTP